MLDEWTSSRLMCSDKKMLCATAMHGSVKFL